MTITSKKQQPPNGFTDLPNEILECVFDHHLTASVTAAQKENPAFTGEQVARAAARGMASMKMISKRISANAAQAINKNCEVALQDTENTIIHIAAQPQFRSRFSDLIRNSKHVAIPFHKIPPNTRHMAMDELLEKDAIAHLQTVKLVLRESLFSLETIAHIVNFFTQYGHPDLKIHLNVSGNGLGNDGAIAISEVLSNSHKIVSLDLSNNCIYAQGAAAIANRLPVSRVTALNFRKNLIGSGGANAITVVLRDTALTKLDLGQNRIDDEGLIGMATGLPGSQVISLDLSKNDIKDRGAKSLAKALRECSVRRLNLNSNQIKGSGTKAIAENLPESRLTHVHLCANGIGTQAAKNIVAVLPQTRLIYLDLANNGIEKSYIDVIASMQKLNPRIHVNY